MEGASANAQEAAASIVQQAAQAAAAGELGNYALYSQAQYSQMVAALAANPQVLQQLSSLPPHQQLLTLQAMSAAATAAAQPAGEEPLYVNAKQYHRILKRREARARWEALHRNPKKDKGYIHESRHKHAMRRPRGPGGRFLSAAEMAALEANKTGSSDGGSPTSPDTSSQSRQTPQQQQQRQTQPQSQPQLQQQPQLTSHQHQHLQNQQHQIQQQQQQQQQLHTQHALHMHHQQQQQQHVAAMQAQQQQQQQQQQQLTPQMVAQMLAQNPSLLAQLNQTNPQLASQIQHQLVRGGPVQVQQQQTAQTRPAGHLVPN
ncbi:Transcriptional activator [Rhizophlyctis rosea]|nr:Transcriptional activator [Rhizophlyctis rosea]